MKVNVMFWLKTTKDLKILIGSLGNCDGFSSLDFRDKITNTLICVTIINRNIRYEWEHEKMLTLYEM